MYILAGMTRFELATPCSRSRSGRFALCAHVPERTSSKDIPDLLTWAVEYKRTFGRIQLGMTKKPHKLFENIKNAFSCFFDEGLIFKQNIQFSCVQMESTTFFIHTNVYGDISLLNFDQRLCPTAEAMIPMLISILLVGFLCTFLS